MTFTQMLTQILAQRLETLESFGLINQVQVEPELEYLFRHALVQEAAYDSLLKQVAPGGWGDIGATLP
jgi:predicted ATPase